MVAETSHGSAFFHIPCAVSAHVVLKYPLQLSAEYRYGIFNVDHSILDVLTYKYHFGVLFLVCTVFSHFIIFLDFAKMYTEQLAQLNLRFIMKRSHISLDSLILRVWFIRKLLIFLFSKRTERNSKFSISSPLHICPSSLNTLKASYLYIWKCSFCFRLPNVDQNNMWH